MPLPRRRTARGGSAWPIRSSSQPARRSLKGIEARQPETYRFEDDGGIPNSPLPVLIYHGVDAAGDAEACEKLLAANGWQPEWRNGIFSFHHFHSISHEALGIVGG